jgi:uncharacterized protein (TIGR00255 family)
MTGYGRASRIFGEKTINVELRSLNSKFTDMRLKIPQSYREKESEFRRIVTEKMERGKIDLLVDVESLTGEEGFALNVPLFKVYYRELSKLSDELSMPKGDIMNAILRLPNVVASSEGAISEKEWEAVMACMSEALEKFNQFRRAEGAAMAEDLRFRIAEIRRALDEVPPFEEDRITRMRQRMWQNLEEFMGKENVDENRYEQEVLFYLEKIDITEEKVRLEQHCIFFMEQLANGDETQKGRQLSFISQEIGREINTLGAKAYSSDIQRLVVKMKDELEKIKELVANVV